MLRKGEEAKRSIRNIESFVYHQSFWPFKDKPSIRASAYVLFGELARFGQGPSKEPYMEQIHSNFVSFLLHLNEADENVKRACKLVLKKVGPLMKSAPVNDLFQATLIENKSLHYGEFINDLSKLLVSSSSPQSTAGCPFLTNLLFKGQRVPGQGQLLHHEQRVELQEPVERDTVQRGPVRRLLAWSLEQ